MGIEAADSIQPPFTVDENGNFHYGRTQLSPEMQEMAMRTSQMFQRHIVAERLTMAETAYIDAVTRSAESSVTDQMAHDTLLETLSSEVQFLHQVLMFMPQ